MLHLDNCDRHPSRKALATQVDELQQCLDCALMAASTLRRALDVAERRAHAAEERAATAQARPRRPQPQSGAMSRMKRRCAGLTRDLSAAEARLQDSEARLAVSTRPVLEGLFRDAGLAARLLELEAENASLRAADAEHACRVAELEAANDELVRGAFESLELPAGAPAAASIAFHTIEEEEEEEEEALQEEEEAEAVEPRTVPVQAPAAHPREMPPSTLRIVALAAPAAGSAAPPAAATAAATPPSQASSAAAWLIAQTPARARPVQSAAVLKTPAWDSIWASTAKKPRAASEYLSPGAEALQQAIDFSHATLTGMKPRRSAAAPANESGCARGFGGRTPARRRSVLGALPMNGAATPLRA